MKTTYSLRVVPSLALALIAIAFVLSAFGQGGLTPAGPPAPTMKTLDQLDTAIAQTNAKVDQSNANIDQANAKIDALAAQGTVEKFTGFAEANVSTAGGRTCAAIAVPDGRTVRLKSIAANTNFDAGATAYIKFQVKKGPGVSRVMTMHVPIINTGSDPVANTRTGFLEIPLRVHGGSTSSSDVALNDVHSLQVCVQASGSGTPESAFVVDGIYE